jgi:N4-gp56 family major capsid protein
MATFSTAQTNFNKTVQELIVAKLEELLRSPLPHLTPGNFQKATLVKGSNGVARFLNVLDVPVDATEAAASIVVTEGTPNTTDTLGLGYEEMTIRQRMKTLKFTDVAILEFPQNLLAIGSDRLARYVVALADFVAAAKIAGGTNVIYSGTGNAARTDVGSGDVLTSFDIKRAVAKLEVTNVPRFGGDTYRGILHSYVKFDVELDDEVGGWIDANRYAGSTALFTGELGKYAGVRFMQSPNAAKFAAGGAGGVDVYSTTIFGPDFFAVGDFGNNATYVTPPGGHDDPGHQSALLTWKGWLDASIMGEGTSATNVTAPRYIRIESATSA